MVPLLESVPNISEGRNPKVLAALRTAMSAPARLLDVHLDADHHRSVYTLVGSTEDLIATLLRGIACAATSIDLRKHSGSHPRIGAADVVPLVPFTPAGQSAAKATALALADRIAIELELPVFFYGQLTEHAREPAFFRRGGSGELQRRIDSGELSPDRGPSQLHPTAGGVILGVRQPLIAFNVNLHTRDLQVARDLAGLVRERDGGLPGVRALGLELPSTGLTQVSMNITDWEASPPHEVVSRITAEAESRGVEVAGSELVGLMPAGAAAAAAASPLRLTDFDQSRLLEVRLVDEVSDSD